MGMNGKRKLVIPFLFLLFLVAGLRLANLASANFMPPPPELPRVYIRTDGSVEPQTLPIQRTGNVYTFNGDIYNLTLEVQRENIVLDGAGYTFEGNGSGFGIILNGTGSVAIKNLNIENFREGISIEHSSGNTITGNSIANNELGIILNDATNNQITENQITSNNQALLLYASASHNNIAQNNITGNGAQGGIWCEFTNYNATDDYNSIVGNNITQNGGTGILLRGSSNDQIENNTIADNQYGISLSGSSCAYNVIRGNKLVGNNNSNIGIGGDPKHNTISENTIANSEIGVDIFNSNNSEFYHNDFINNKKQVNNGYVNDSFGFIAPAVNIWDKNYAGNYWSDYNGTDMNHDGTGDTPYVVDSSNLDHYPLMTPYNGPMPQPSQSPILSMPQEYINYTVSMDNGSLWATVDGTYPMHLSPEWVGQELPLAYPTPPGTTNIRIELDGKQLTWSNYTQSVPDALHYTYLGEWPMILCTIQPSSTDFTLKIHYQHPILEANGTYLFLYDLNISPYLSASSSSSRAYFNVRFEANCSDIHVYTVPGDSSTPRDNTRTPVNFTTSDDNGTETVGFTITSDYYKPVPGDELVTFENSQAQVPEFPSWIILLLLLCAMTLTIVFAKNKLRRNHSR